MKYQFQAIVYVCVCVYATARTIARLSVARCIHLNSENCYIVRIGNGQRYTYARYGRPETDMCISIRYYFYFFFSFSFAFFGIGLAAAEIIYTVWLRSHSVESDR